MKTIIKGGEKLKTIWTPFRTVFVLSLFLMVFVLSGCGQNTSPKENVTSSKQNDTASNSSTSTSQQTSEMKTTASPVQLTFYYPVGVTGPLSEIMQKMVQQFNDEHPNIQVKAVFTGSYNDNTAKIITSLKGGNPPDVVISLSQDLTMLLDLDAIQPFDELFASKDPALQFDESDFFPAFMLNSSRDGKIWGIPFQRSTPVMYYNKEAFKEANLDPQKPPETWDELVKMASQTMVKDKAGKVQRWGVEIPISGTSTWLFEALAIEAGKDIYNGNPAAIELDTPESKHAMQWLIDLSKKYKVMPEGVIDWSAASTDFTSGATTFLYHSPGSLSAIMKQAPFEVGVAFLPKDKQYGVPTGGGNLYIMKGIPEERRQAAWTFVQWMVAPDRAAQWSIDTGYVPVRKAAEQTKLWQDYIAGRPQAQIALEQLPYAQAELDTHKRSEVQKMVADAIQAVLSGSQSIDDAFNNAQKQIDQVLKPYQK